MGRETDLEALDAYFSLGYVPDPLTIFRGVKKLPPGCHLTFSNGVAETAQYWDFNYEKNLSPAREEDYLDELRRLLDEAVKVRLVADVPLGAFLSGGIDFKHRGRLDGPQHGQSSQTFL